MGRTVTPKYVVHTRHNDRGHYHIPIAWRVRAQYGIPGDGRPTDANLAKWVAGYNRSFEPGGTNEHISDAAGFIVRIHHAEIRENRPGGAVLATYDAPLFEVVS